MEQGSVPWIYVLECLDEVLDSTDFSVRLLAHRRSSVSRGQGGLDLLTNYAGNEALSYYY